MAGGRFASELVGGYEAKKIFTNCCGAAASITIATAGLQQTCAPTFSVSISNGNVCTAGTTSFANGTFDYNNMGAVLVSNSGAFDGIVCFSSTRCCCFKHLTYVSNTGVSNTASGWICQSFYRDYYYPTPYPSETVLGFSDCCGCCAYSAVISGSNVIYSAISNCYCGSGNGTIAVSCYYCALVATCVGQICAAASCCVFAIVGTRPLGYCACFPNFTAMDYWSTSKPFYSYFSVFGTNCSRLTVSATCYVVTCSPCISATILGCCSYNAKGFVCTLCGYDSATTSYCCSDLNPAGQIIGCSDIYTCFCTCFFCCKKLGNYPLWCDDIFCAQRFLLTGCSLVIFQNPMTGTAAFRAATYNSSVACLTDSTAYGCGLPMTVSPCQTLGFRCGQSVLLCACTGTDAYSHVKWATYNARTQCNVFMIYNCCTPLWNGIWAANSTAMLCIACLSVVIAGNIAYICYPTLLTSLFTKVADVPSCWCAIGARNLTTTTPVAVSPTEFVTYVGDLTVGGLTGCLFRYSTSDLSTWCLSDSRLYNCCISQCCTIIGNTTTIYKTTSNFESCVPLSGALETCTSIKNLERTGIVVSNGDAVHVRNYSNVPIAVNIWGYVES